MKWTLDFWVLQKVWSRGGSPSCRFFRHEVQHSAPDVCLSGSGPRRDGCECICSSLDRSEDLCLSSDKSQTLEKAEREQPDMVLIAPFCQHDFGSANSWSSQRAEFFRLALLSEVLTLPCSGVYYHNQDVLSLTVFWFYQWDLNVRVFLNQLFLPYWCLEGELLTMFIIVAGNPGFDFVNHKV